MKGTRKDAEKWTGIREDWTMEFLCTVDSTIATVF